jgi:NADH-quinone oxidoreductase subunit N
MTGHDVYLLAPELSLIVTALVVLFADSVLKDRRALPVIVLAGLAVTLALTITLWVDLDTGAAAMTGVFGTLVVDKFSLFFKFLLAGIMTVVVLMSIGYIRRFDSLRAEYFALILFSLTGMMLLASTLELVTIYIALELTALPLVALIAVAGSSRSSEAGMKFLILSAVSSALLLYGMVWIYGLTGSTDLGEIARGILGSKEVTEPMGGYAILLGVVLIIAGFGFKISTVPFHMWVPDVYEGAPTPITAFLSVASKAAGFAVILRVFYIAFPETSVSLEWSAIFAVLAIMSMTLGNFVAIAQKGIKRLLAYSTIAHAGYIMIGLAAIAARDPGSGAADGPGGVLFYLAGYAATNLAAFAAVIAISNRVGSDRITDFAGMGRRSPWLAAALAFALISLTGVPPTVGFMVKLNIFSAAAGSGLSWLVLAGTLSSVVSAYYYMRVIKVMYLSEPVDDAPVTADRPLQVALGVSVAALLFFGIYPTPLIRMATTAAEVLSVVPIG